VTGVPRRLAEAARIGFTHALIPAGAGPAPDGLNALEVSDLRSVLSRLGLDGG
jgi:DNA repair protein RadA/Sms